jgi:hypothetical protein
MPSLRRLRRRLAARCTPREHILVLARLVPAIEQSLFPHLAHRRKFLSRAALVGLLVCTGPR